MLLPSRSIPPERPQASGGDARDWTRALREAAPFLGLGMTLAVTVLAGVGGGYWLDGRLGTRPAFLLLGGTLGVGAALYHLLTAVVGPDKRRAGPKR
jgi:F0F1-type ATP synthase assembly protein I